MPTIGGLYWPKGLNAQLDFSKGQTMARKPNRMKMLLVALVCGGIQLVTTATCDPYTGVLDFYRNHGGSYYDVYYPDVVYVDPYDCIFPICF